MNESDDMWTPENWIKANPILEYDRDALQNMIPIAATAKEMGGSTLRDFIVKQLNMWIQWTNDVYIKDMDVWTRAAVKKTLADFRGQKAYVGLDLSSGGDLTSIAIVIPFMQGEDKCYFVHAHSFIRSEGLKNTSRLTAYLMIYGSDKDWSK
jgi:phage terminase large subunit-like protein